MDDIQREFCIFKDNLRYALKKGKRDIKKGVQLIMDSFIMYACPDDCVTNGMICERCNTQLTEAFKELFKYSK